jgi:hypothetical protein
MGDQMNTAYRRPTRDRPVTYQIKIQGRLDESWSDWLEGMAITYESGSEGSSTTTLTGAIMDQAALSGILTRIWSLNLTLISVTRIETNSKEEP